MSWNRKKDYPHGTVLHACTFEGCTYTSPERFSLKRHLSTHTRALCTWACAEPGCSYATGIHSNLLRHSFTHAEVKPHACDFPECARGYVSRADLLQHKWTAHSATREALAAEGYVFRPPRPHSLVCPFKGCGERCAAKSALRAHWLEKHGPAPFPCEVCGWEGFCKTDIRAHLAGRRHQRRMLFHGWAEHARKCEEQHQRHRLRAAGTPWEEGEDAALAHASIRGEEDEEEEEEEEEEERW